MSKKIDKKTAKGWVSKFKNHGNAASSAMFTKAAVESILKQDGCLGLRIYNGYDENETDPKKKFTMFLVGTTADGTNLLPTADDTTNEKYFIEDDAKACPPNCPPNDL